MMNSFPRPLAAILLAVLAFPAAAQEPARLPPVVAVETVRIVPFAQEVSFTGIVAAAVVNDLSFRTGGRVLERLVETGDAVEAGQAVARLDRREQEADMRAAQAGLDAAEAQLSLARSGFERQEALFGQGVVTRRALDDATQALRVAEADVQVAQARLANAKEALGHAELRAEADGIVLSHAIEPGQIVQATQSVVRVAMSGGRDAVFNIDEAFMAEHRSQDVLLALVSDRAVTAGGSIREISPVVDRTSGTIRVKVAIADTPDAFTLGAPVVGTFGGNSGGAGARPVASVPWQALIKTAEGPAVWVLDRETDTVSARPIAVLAYRSDSVLVADGLSEGETVVTRGSHLLQQGHRVEIQGSGI